MKIFRDQKNKQQLAKKFLKVATVAGAFGVIGLANAETVHGHGFVEAPASRAFMGHQLRNQPGWTWNSIWARYGASVNEPQSIEGPGSNHLTGLGAFPEGGPADGQIASGGLVSGALDFSPLDIQREGHWRTHDINPGVNEFTWFLTAGHVTRDFRYFITREGWDPNTPLTRADLELIEVIEYNSGHLGDGVRRTHQVNIPNDRTGYHVVLAVWDVGDTDMAFYQVIDVYITNDEVDSIPIPEGDHPDLQCCDTEAEPESPEAEPESPEADPENLDGYPQWSPHVFYQEGDRVIFNGQVWEAQQTIQGWGDLNWAPGPLTGALWVRVN